MYPASMLSNIANDEEERRRRSLIQPRSAPAAQPPVLPDTSMPALPDIQPTPSLIQPRAQPSAQPALPLPPVSADPNALRLNTGAGMGGVALPDNGAISAQRPSLIQPRFADNSAPLPQGGHMLTQTDGPAAPTSLIGPRPTAATGLDNAGGTKYARGIQEPLQSTVDPYDLRAQAQRDIGPQKKRGFLGVLKDVGLGLAMGGVGGAAAAGIKGGDWAYDHKLGERIGDLAQAEQGRHQATVDDLNVRNRDSLIQDRNHDNLVADQRLNDQRTEFEKKTGILQGRLDETTKNDQQKAAQLKEHRDNQTRLREITQLQTSLYHLDPRTPNYNETRQAIIKEIANRKLNLPEEYRSIVPGGAPRTTTDENGQVVTVDPYASTAQPVDMNGQPVMKPVGKGHGGGRGQGIGPRNSQNPNEYTDRASALDREMPRNDQGETIDPRTHRVLSAYEKDTKIRAELKREGVKPLHKPYQPPVVPHPGASLQPGQTQDPRKQELMSHIQAAKIQLGQSKDPADQQKLKDFIQRAEAQVK